MMQHLVVTLIFAGCLCLVIRRIVRIVSRAKRNEPQCDTCTEHSCPLREASGGKRRDCDCNCGCGCSSTKGRG